MQTGLVSTIIPVFNRPRMLREAVESVLNQSYQSIEIIIIDDGSSDNTLEVAKQLAASNINTQAISIENSGPGLAREKGRKIAKGEFIQYLDSDDLLHPEKFAKQVSGLNRDKHCDVSYCVQQLCDMQNNVLDAAWMRTSERFDKMFPTMLAGRIWGTPVPLYRASLLNKAGPWLDIRNQEDWEYDCRVASYDVALHYCDETLVTIRRHDQEHLGNISHQQTYKIADKAIAYYEIHRSALRGNLDKQTEESQRFNRMVFLLARQCAQHGLVAQAKSLMRLCSERSLGRLDASEFLLYSAVSSLIGWQNMAKLASALRRYI